MGYLSQQNGLINYKTVVPASSCLTLGTVPYDLNTYYNSDLNGIVFVPLMAIFRLVNQNTAYNFSAGAHLTIKDSAGVEVFVHTQNLNNIQPDLYFYPIAYISQVRNQFTNGNFPIKQSSGVNFSLTTENGGDATLGDGDLNVTISGYFTQI